MKQLFDSLINRVRSLFAPVPVPPAVPTVEEEDHGGILGIPDEPYDLDRL